MSRSLLALMLITTQLQSWSGSALYLCLNVDGSFCCLDTGPDSCDCRHHEDEHHDLGTSVCREHQHDDESPATDEQGWLTLPCDCTHVLIVCERAPMVSRVSSTTNCDHDARIHSQAMSALGAVAMEGLRADRSCMFRPQANSAPSSADFRSVVLRC